MTLTFDDGSTINHQFYDWIDPTVPMPADFTGDDGIVTYQIIHFDHPRETRAIQITVNSVYTEPSPWDPDQKRYNDTCISEIQPFTTDIPPTGNDVVGSFSSEG